jgi:hypothetical protein
MPNTAVSATLVCGSDKNPHTNATNNSLACIADGNYQITLTSIIGKLMHQVLIRAIKSMTHSIIYMEIGHIYRAADTSQIHGKNGSCRCRGWHKPSKMSTSNTTLQREIAAASRSCSFPPLPGAEGAGRTTKPPR